MKSSAEAPVAVAPAGIVAGSTAERSEQAVRPEVLERDAEIRRREVAQNLVLNQRPSYAKACWSPTVMAGRTESPPIRLTIELDAQGNEVRRQAENAMPPPLRLAQDEAVLKCVASDAVPRLRLNSPGKPVTLRLNLSFP